MYFKGLFQKLLFVFIVLSCVALLSFAKTKKEEEYDRLDGMGKSGKRVDVIEWHDNLEIHVYPAGSLAGLGLKLVKEGGKSIMVISYRFHNSSAPLVRRAVLGIPFKEKFQAFKDSSATKDGYDKIIISNALLTSSKVASFKLDPEPTQLYPDGHPMLADKGDEQDKLPHANTSSAQQERKPASRNEEIENNNLESDSVPTPNGIRSFSW
jgi:hypothetical protein